MGAAEVLHKRVAMSLVYREDLPRYEGSLPSIEEFNPRFIPWQYDVLRFVRSEYDYSQGKLEIMLSGALGSAKSLLLAHVVVTHCLQNNKARACIARRTLPDLKDTLFADILEHISGTLTEGRDYAVVATRGYIRFANGSEIISRSWADKKYKKGRSLKLSMLVVEELTENDEEAKEAIMELNNRVGRLPHVIENIFIAATNPDEPDHWAYAYFIEGQSATRKVFYSVTTDNPFLPPWYREQLLRDMDPKMALRMIHGRWISLNKETVYYQYDRARHEPANEYKVNPALPIVMSWDFNIGAGKPISATFSQWDGVKKHFYGEVVIEGGRTQNVLEEAWNRGLFEPRTMYIIRGDATGKHGDTRHNISDYQVIHEWLSNKVRTDQSRVMFQRNVPLANPPLRSRHNVVNAWLLNDLGEVRIQVYPGCKVLKEGFKHVKLKPGAQYIEDDSKFFQHVTTAMAYDVYMENATMRRSRTTETEL